MPDMFVDPNSVVIPTGYDREEIRLTVNGEQYTVAVFGRCWRCRCMVGTADFGDHDNYHSWSGR